MATLPANARKEARSGEIETIRRLATLCKRSGFEARTSKAEDPPTNSDRYKEWQERTLLCVRTLQVAISSLARPGRVQQEPVAHFCACTQTVKTPHLAQHITHLDAHTPPRLSRYH